MIHIRVVSLNGQPPEQEMGCTFDESGGSIGRAETNRLVLADPDRHVSRLQARLACRDGDYELTNLGANSIVVAGRDLANGAAISLQPGNRIELGGYVLEVCAEAPVSGQSAGGRVGASDDPLGLLGDGAGSVGSDPFQEILGGANPADAAPAGKPHRGTSAPEVGSSIASPADPPAPAAPGSGVIPEDFDPFADPFAPPPADKGAEARSLDELGIRADGGDGGEPGIDTLFGLDPAASSGTADPFADSALGAPRSSAGAEGGGLDPLAALSGTPSRAPDEASVPDQVPEIRGAFRPPPVAGSGAAVLSWEQGAGAGGIIKETVHSLTEPTSMPSAVQIEGSIAPPPSVGGLRSSATGQTAAPVSDTAVSAKGAATDETSVANADALAKAFLSGLGMPDLPLPPNTTPEMMERVGRLLREATQGTVDLLLARAATKRELRAELTMIVSRENNPLKFSPTVEVALAHLLTPQGRGFLPPVEAMRDAFDDLRSHQVGFMAGLRAALNGVLTRFDPGTLEQRLSEKSVLDSLLPMNRRAKLWGLYTELYRDIAEEAEDDFHKLFGREFLRAYEEHVARLQDRDR